MPRGRLSVDRTLRLPRHLIHTWRADAAISGPVGPIFARSRRAIQCQTIRSASGSTAVTLGVTPRSAEDSGRHGVRAIRPKVRASRGACWCEIARAEIAEIARVLAEFQDAEGWPSGRWRWS